MSSGRIMMNGWRGRADALLALKIEYPSWEGFDEAILGTADQSSQGSILYDYESMIDILINRDGMTREDAAEFIEFNVAGGFIGDQTPLIFYTVEGLGPKWPEIKGNADGED